MRSFTVWAGTGGLALIMIGIVVWRTGQISESFTEFEDVASAMPPSPRPYTESGVVIYEQIDKPSEHITYQANKPSFEEFGSEPITQYQFDLFLKANPSLVDPRELPDE